MKASATARLEDMGWQEGVSKAFVDSPRLVCAVLLLGIGPRAFWDMQRKIDNLFLAGSHTKRWEGMLAVQCFQVLCWFAEWQ